MNTPPRKLLKVAKKISANSPGTAPITRTVPAMSTRFGSAFSPSAGCGLPSSMWTKARCRNTRAVATNARSRVAYMPPQATRKPLITEVVRKPMPLTMPTRPLALSRSPSGIRMVTSVGRAMLRILPAMTPSITSSTNAQR